jgi:hypothetical protein
MAFELKIEAGIAWIRFHGQLTSADLVGGAEGLAKMETEAEVAPDRISDLSSIDGLTLDFAAVEACASLRRSAPLKNLVKSAIIAPTPVQFGFARMFQTLNTNPKVTVRIFTDAESALAWFATGVGGVGGGVGSDSMQP